MDGFLDGPVALPGCSLEELGTLWSRENKSLRAIPKLLQPRKMGWAPQFQGGNWGGTGQPGRGWEGLGTPWSRENKSLRAIPKLLQPGRPGWAPSCPYWVDVAGTLGALGSPGGWQVPVPRGASLPLLPGNLWRCCSCLGLLQMWPHLAGEEGSTPAPACACSCHTSWVKLSFTRPSSWKPSVGL